jgi:hypothetical protein
MRIEIETREVYGLTKAYPVNEAAHVLAELVGTKTLTRVTLDRAAKLGHEIVEVPRDGLAKI